MAILSSFSFRLASKYLYWRAFHKRLNLKNPGTFNEELMKLKLETYASDPLIARCADKFEVRSYVTESGCPELLIPLLGVWETPEEIPFESLPEQFVLKCNHGCGYNIVCTSKSSLDIPYGKRLLKKWLREDFWRRFGECNYKSIKKKILCEAYIGTDTMPVPIDYKFYCFHGTAQYVMVCCGRSLGKPQFFFFDRKWKLARINQNGISAPDNFSLPKPKRLEDMFSYADRLSAPFPFVRVDMYASDTDIYFGELTFTPAAAVDTARHPKADRLFCNLLKQP